MREDETNMKTNKWRMHGSGGFTLLEILLVVVIIGMLVGIAAVKLGPQAKEAKAVAARAQIHSYKQALDLYELNNGIYPTGEQGLQALITMPAGAPNWKGPYLDAQTPRKDPWNRDYIYKFPGTKNPTGYDVYSTGPDGVEGNEDDIGNWQ